MNLNYRLSFCNVCKKRAKDGEFIICGVTNKTPDFNETCENFELDALELNALEKEIFNNENPPKSIIDKIVFNSNHIQNTKSFKTKKDLSNKIVNEKVIIYKNKYYYLGLLFIFTLIASTYLIANNKNIFSNIIIICLLILSYSSYYFWIKKRKPIIILNKEGILYLNNLIYWNSIITTFIKTISDEDSTIYYLIIHTHEDFEVFEIKIDSLTETVEDIAALIEIYKERYKKNIS